MSESNYKVHKEWVKEAEFEVLILEIPREDVEDKLAYLAREKGSITKSFFEDFVIATCVANINQLLFHIKQQHINSPSLMKVRAEVMGLILNINPVLDPENLVINHNAVIKIKDKDSKGSKEDERPLTENKSWNISYYDEVVDQYEGDPSVVSKNITNIKGKKGLPAELKNMDDLEFEVVKQWWQRINKYIEIKKFNSDDVTTLLSQRYFHNRSSFQTYVVSVCVVNSEDLFIMLDNMGIPSRVAPPILMHEVYELCKELNPFLTYENAQEFTEGLVDDDDTQTNSPQRNTCKMSSHAKQHVNKKKQTKKRFKDVPKADLLRLASAMKVFVVGQDEAVDNIVEAVQRASVGLKDPNKPIGSFLFAGRTGVGKTTSTKVLADELIKDRNNLVNIDCSEYSADHEYAKLIGCFVPGTKIKMSTGQEKNIEEIEVGESVISHTGVNRRVEQIHEYDQAGEMISLQMSNTSVPVITTKTHEILAIKHKNCDKGEKRSYRVCKPTCKQTYCVNPPYENYKLEWVPASELEVNDVLVYPRYKPTGKYPTTLDMVDYIDDLTNYKYDDNFIWAQEHVKVPRYIDVNEDFTRLVGYYVSEGGISGSAKTLNFTFNNKELGYITETVKLIRKIFGREVRIRIEDRTNSGSYRVWVSSKIVCNFMASLFGNNTYVKKLPAWFKDIPDNMVKNFLETAVFGDGCTVVPRRMDYSTVSSSLFTMMEILFRRLGYITYKQIEVKKNPKHKDRYRLYISGNQIEKLNEDFNFGIDLSEMESTNIQRKAWVDENYVYFQLKDVSRINYTGKVYDLSVEKDVSYVTEFIVHNSPSGYVGHEQGGILTNAIIENPFSVVVFDEVEKASTKIHELLLQILEEGRLTDGKGQKVSFKDCLIIMTSNVGVSEIDEVKKTIGFGDVAEVTEERKVKAIDKAIKKKFKPEFLNRIDAIVHFNTLKKADYMRIIDIELYKLNENLKANDTEYKNIRIEFDKKVKDFIYKEGVNPEYGARPLKRCIEKEISTPLAATLLREEFDGSARVKVSIKKGKPAFSFENDFFKSEEHKKMVVEE